MITTAKNSEKKGSQTSSDYDICILGGGLAGLTLALHCRQQIPHASIAVIEKRKHPVPEAAFKVGESSVELSAYYFSKVLDLEEHIAKDQLPKFGLRFFFPNGDNADISQRLELGGKRYAPVPSYQFDRGRFENYLARRCEQQGVEFIDGATIRHVELTGGRMRHEVEAVRDGETIKMRARWVADASGRAAVIKRKLGLGLESNHKCNAVWLRVDDKINVDDWCDDPEWRAGHADLTSRWYSTNHLMGEGYWVWLIPLASGATSIGIVADEQFHPLSTFNSLEKSLAWLDRHEPQCAAAIRERRDKIQDFLAIKHYSRECKQVFSHKRWGIVGEAGYFLDPFYSPGSDFIAFGNTFLVDLIRREMKGQSIRFRAFLYNSLYKTFHHGTLQVYQDQYQLFGNQQVMPVKVMWDYMVYWTLSCFVFMHGRTCNQFMYPRHMFKLKKLSEMNRCMQGLFRAWHQQNPGRDISGTIDISSIQLIRETNASLADELGHGAYSKRFSENVKQMERLFWEIVDHAQVDHPIPFQRRSRSAVQQKSFEKIFAATKAENPSHQLASVEA